MEIPRHWRLKKQRYSLIGEECPGCGEKIFPPRDICPVDGTTMGPFSPELSLKGLWELDSQAIPVKGADAYWGKYFLGEVEAGRTPLDYLTWQATMGWK